MRVVAIQSGSHHFAYRDLLAYPIVDQGLQLVVARRASPRLGVRRDQVLDLDVGYDDALLPDPGPDSAPWKYRNSATPISRKCRSGSLTSDLYCMVGAPGLYVGVYQIGAV